MLKTKIFTFIKRRIHPVKWYNLRKLIPVSNVFGLDRGMPVDRYYIEQFLIKNKDDIKGSVLEIAESTYSRKFGNSPINYEVLDFSKNNPNATIIGDLTDINTLPEGTINCFICTQTLNFIYDFKSAIKGCYHLLRKEGVLLVTVGGISQISTYDMDRWGDYWRFTTLSALRAFTEVFGTDNVEVNSYGNVLSSIAFLEGISANELSKKELDYKDDDYQMLITVRAVK